jgi:CarboxypepD_reg-like domain/TonB dependent receptor/TonB-dependent Receptor Plug Domain
MKNFAIKILTILFLGGPLSITTIFGQNFTISGTLKDATNGEDLIGASVVLKDKPSVGVTTNTYGFYSLTLPKGSYTIRFQYIGYTAIDEKIVLDKDLKFNKELSPESTLIQEVVIKAEKDNKNVSRNDMSVTKLDPKSVENVPVIFGEKDIIKTLQLTPGVKSAGEGNSGFYVRGGAADQNLILLDEAPVYNASHLLGFFSVFNSDALKDVTLYKGSAPAEFGGRGSSVLDIKMKDGNNKKFNASGGLGAISSRLTLEAPLQKDEGSVMISARRTYADLFLKLLKDTTINQNVLYFYDLNAKANYRLGKKDRLFLSGYFGRDVLGAQGFGLNWGNYTGTLRWNHLFSDKLFSNTSVIYSNFDYQFNVGRTADVAFTVKAAIKDINAKQDFTYFPNNKNTIKFGVNFIDHTFLPTSLTAGPKSGFANSVTPNKYAYEGGIYVQNDMKVNEKIGFQYGLRYSFFDYRGAGTAYTFNNFGDQTSKIDYTSKQSIKFYGGFEPRFSGKYQLNDESSIKASYSRNYQFLHLLSNSTTSSPTDLWVPSSNNVKPQLIDQVSLGYFRNFNDNAYEFSFETYYKTLQNQIDYRNGADLIFNDKYEGALTYGKGIAYGAEFYLKKIKGDFTGWISYTLSRSLRQFNDINKGDFYPAKQDRIHDISIVGIYKLSKKLTVSANWVFYTGDAVTFPSGKYKVEGATIPYYTERNGYRFPNYHRLDLGVTLQGKQRKNYESSWNFSVYNAYARENAYSITFQQNKDNPQKTEALRTSLFRIIPSVTYNFKFK